MAPAPAPGKLLLHVDCQYNPSQYNTVRQAASRPTEANAGSGARAALDMGSPACPEPIFAIKHAGTESPTASPPASPSPSPSCAILYYTLPSPFRRCETTTTATTTPATPHDTAATRNHSPPPALLFTTPALPYPPTIHPYYINIPPPLSATPAPPPPSTPPLAPLSLSVPPTAAHPSTSTHAHAHARMRPGDLHRQR